VKSVATVPASSHLIWEPVHLPARQAQDAEVAAILITASGGDLVVLKPHKAGARCEWQITVSPAAIALVYGPQGLSEGKVKSLVTRNQALVGQIADYAEQTSKVETLVQELSDAEQSGGGADAALKGFAARYDVALPKLDAKASTDQQAAVLLKTLLPTTNTYDPLAARSAQMQRPVWRRRWRGCSSEAAWAWPPAGRRYSPISKARSFLVWSSARRSRRMRIEAG
jgi:hypothetical protein